MWAIVRINTCDPEKLVARGPEIQAFNEAHGNQPGYAGRLTVELGAGRRLVVNL